LKVGVVEAKHRMGAVEPFALTEPLPPLEGEDGPIALNGPVTVRGDIYNTGSSLVVRGTARASVLLTCSRCAKPFEQSVQAPIEVEFVQGRPGVAHEENEEGLERVPYEGDEVDLSDEVRQRLVLALPMKPLCSDGCLGLCPTCGKDLNEGPCDCRPGSDERLAGLAEFLKRPAADNPSDGGGGNNGSAKKKDLPR